MENLPNDLDTLLEAVEAMMGEEFAAWLEAVMDVKQDDTYADAYLKGWHDRFPRAGSAVGQ